jgi:hypothetical protein
MDAQPGQQSGKWGIGHLLTKGEAQARLNELERDKAAARTDIRAALERFAAKHGIAARQINLTVQDYADRMVGDATRELERRLASQIEAGASVEQVVYRYAQAETLARSATARWLKEPSDENAVAEAAAFVALDCALKALRHRISGRSYDDIRRRRASLVAAWEMRRKARNLKSQRSFRLD